MVLHVFATGPSLLSFASRGGFFDLCSAVFWQVPRPKHDQDATSDLNDFFFKKLPKFCLSLDAVTGCIRKNWLYTQTQNCLPYRCFGDANGAGLGTPRHLQKHRTYSFFPNVGSLSITPFFAFTAAILR